MSNARPPQRPLNSSFAPKIGRDGNVPKNTVENIPVAHGMKNRTLQAGPGVIRAERTVDDEPLQRSYEGKNVPVHPSMAHRDNGSADIGVKVLNDAKNLGKGPVINDKANGRTNDGGSAPVTSKD